MDRCQLALQAAEIAGKMTLGYFRNPNLEIEQKEDQTPVTAADRQAEHAVRQLIADHFPDDGVIGEEFEDVPSRSGYRWIIDPIDGTKSFVHGVPLYGTLVAVESEERVEIGVVHMPALAETVYAERGRGCWFRDGEREEIPAEVSKTPKLEEAVFCTNSPAGFDKIERADVFQTLAARCYMTRGWSDCYGYVLLATGRIDLMIDPLMSVWDCAALQPIVVEAGGRFSDWQDQETIRGGNAIGSNGVLHQQVMDIVKR